MLTERVLDSTDRLSAILTRWGSCCNEVEFYLRQSSHAMTCKTINKFSALTVFDVVNMWIFFP